eukprot:464337_1
MAANTKHEGDEDIVQDIDNIHETRRYPSTEMHQFQQSIPIQQKQIGENGNNINLKTITVAILISYSVVISTVALIIALNNSSNSTCDCTLDNLAAKTESIPHSNFCNMINECIEITDNSTISPSILPSKYASNTPTINPNIFPSAHPTLSPSINPSDFPSNTPSNFPSINPSNFPSNTPSNFPSINPSQFPSINPSNFPSINPSLSPTLYPTLNPTPTPTISTGTMVQIQKIISHKKVMFSTSGSWIEPSTTYRISITPKFIDSDLLITYNFGWYGWDFSAGEYCVIHLSAARSINGSIFSRSDIYSAGYANETQPISGISRKLNGFYAGNDPNFCHWVTYDHPNTLQTVTYALHVFQGTSGAGKIKIGQSVTTEPSGGGALILEWSMPVTIIAMEIKN